MDQGKGAALLYVRGGENAINGRD